MPPRRNSTTGFRGVRARQNGMFSADIRWGDDRIPLGTFATAAEAARAWDAAAWRLNRPRSLMNFNDCHTVWEAEARAPKPQIITAADHLHLRHRAFQGLVDAREDRVVREYYRNNPGEESADEELWQTRAAERAERRLERHLALDAAREARTNALQELRRADRAGEVWASDDPRWGPISDIPSCTSDDDEEVTDEFPDDDEE